MGSAYTESLNRLIEEFGKLPGIGPKSAERLAFYLLKAQPAEALALADAIRDLKNKIKRCEICYNLAEQNICQICSDERRDKSVICVVEQPSDVMVIEKTSEYRGVYHVIHGIISPIDNIGPDDLRINTLADRLRNGKVTEVIIATNPTTEGDVTAIYIAKLIKPLGITVTRIARGLPMGSDLDLADTTTLSRALEGRREI